VENTCGTSPFTLDPSRHKIMENTITLPPNVRPPHILPDYKTAKILVDAYFTNTCGLVEIFNRASFVKKMDACFNDPLSIDSTYLCLLYLTFAIGLVMATPSPGSGEEEAIKRLKSAPFDRAEVFFRSAKCLADPVSGFEDADFWSVQALSLMSVYMLAVSKRNAAYAYYGMAVRSAFALGLHRVLETRIIFSAEEAIVRRNLWRSLFVLDRFLAASLGRPTAISEDDCSPDALDSPIKSIDAPNSQYTPSSSFQNAGLDASVEACKVIGRILKKVYAKRKASIRKAQDFADEIAKLEQLIKADLFWRRALSPEIDAAHGIAILHVNLLCCHSVILYARPFFLYLIIKDHRPGKPGARRAPRLKSRMDRFAFHCVSTSTHTIDLVQTAYERNYLPQRNPFVLYVVVSCCWPVDTGEHANLHAPLQILSLCGFPHSTQQRIRGSAGQPVLREIHHPSDRPHRLLSGVRPSGRASEVYFARIQRCRREKATGLYESNRRRWRTSDIAYSSTAYRKRRSPRPVNLSGQLPWRLCRPRPERRLGDSSGNQRAASRYQHGSSLHHSGQGRGRRRRQRRIPCKHRRSLGRRLYVS
jgi:hypothetical protein